METVRIFISSPGDVIPERNQATRVIERLGRRFANVLSLVPVRWEWQPLDATKHFQANIIPPSRTDIVVVILWSRLGTPLPACPEFEGRKSHAQVTGTEWEFEEAFDACETSGRPRLLVYVKRAPVEARFDDPDDPGLDRMRDEKRRLNAFLATWFQGGDGAAFKGAWRDFADTAAFEEMLEQHLERLLIERLEGRPAVAAASHGPGENPFRGLEPFDVANAAVFFGRTRARNELREALVRQAAKGTAFVAVTGPSGSGKSSLVCAGLIPDLLLDGMVPGVGLVRYATIRPRDAAGNPLAALAGIVTSALRLGEPPLSYPEGRLERIWSRDPAEGMLPVQQGLSIAAAGAPLREGTVARLLVVVDQLEELFTLPIAEEAREAFIAALDSLARSPLAWVVATLRTEFLPRVAQVPRLAALARGEGTFLLSPPTEEELRQIIVRPAQVARVEYEPGDQGERLEDELCAAAARHPGTLPLLEYLLDRLWQKRGATGNLTYAAYRELGKLGGAIGQRAEEVFLGLEEPVQAALPAVLRALVTIAWSDGVPTVTSRPASFAAFPDGTPARRLIEALASPDARLLVPDGDRVRVAHDAVLANWSRAAGHIEQDKRDLQTRDRLEQDATEWEQAAPDARPGFLIPSGARLSLAEDLLERREAELSARVRAYVDASSRAHRDQQARELEAERQRRVEAERRQIRAEVAEQRAAAERGYARAERNRALARRVGQKPSPLHKQYAAVVLQRAAVFESQANEQWNLAYEMERKLGPSREAPAESPVQSDVGLFELDVLSTGQRGASLVLRYGHPPSPRLVIVDGGDRLEYATGLKRRLAELQAELAPAAPLPVELVVVTHYDRDRVEGIEKLLDEMLEAARAGRRPPVDVKALWFNQFAPEDEKGHGRRPAASRKDRMLDAARELGVEVNQPFDYFVMAGERGPSQVALAEGMKVTVLGPDAVWLRKFYEVWLHESHRRGDGSTDLLQQARLAPEDDGLFEAIRSIPEGFSSPEIELLRAPADVVSVAPPRLADMSASNLSSIVTLFEHGGRRVLFCGDGRCDNITRGLSSAGLLPFDGVLELDVMEVPHHGSRRNVTPDFFRLVQARHYVVGGHATFFHLPDTETLEMIVEARGDGNYVIHLPGGSSMPWLHRGQWSARLRDHVALHDPGRFTIDVAETADARQASA